MIDIDLLNMKIHKKEQSSFGLSLVYLFENLGNDPFGLHNALQNFEDCFIWNKTCSLHITLLRCKSKKDDFLLPQLDAYDCLLIHKPSFTLQSLSTRLDNDGVIRTHFSSIPHDYWYDLDTNNLGKETGMSYKIITKPWITFAYANSCKIKELLKFESQINQKLNNILFNKFLSINSLSLVKYSDTSFNNVKIVKKYELEV